MARVIAYNVLLFACFFYALRRGGAPERIGAAAMLAGSLATLALRYTPDDFDDLEPALLAIDVAVFAVLLLLAIAAERYWPICVAGLQGATVMSHVPVTLQDRNVAFAYAAVLALWAYPILVVILIGTARHRRRERVNGSDPSWKPSFVRSMRRLRRKAPIG